MPGDPMELLSRWLEEAGASGNPEPTAMTLSTVGPDGQPSSRIVLLKQISQGTLVFFTNYNSRKGREIAVNIRVAANFFWPELERQVRIEGTVKRIGDDESGRYFRSRPFESQISAWASPQSERIPDRGFLERAYERFRKKFERAEEVPRPAHWGGYAMIPSRIEFWRGRSARLHDRIEYLRVNDRWVMARLAP
ncbi:MAG TPA: pyridoxamine 5'-phosphate oxidase [Bacteroides sp.]|nr:pyridoxamine 5'-phosphate oxidase [Bacteroides sp.]